ncbi:MAG: transposase [Isosphaeraceae bacterium]|nr:transposase [Isosphaeraceae bacterium]
MARTARASVGGLCYHALNRGNRRETVFHKAGDYDAFLDAMFDASARTSMDLLGYCVMPNHFHLILRPQADGDLSRWMQWLLTAHARRYHRHYKTTGHVWQARFKAFPIEADEHLVTVPRYVERNPLRAELVVRAEDWRWSSLAAWLGGDGPLWRGEPPLRDTQWLERVNEPLSAGDLKRLLHAVERGAPFGGESWTRTTAERLGLESCLRPRGRPKKRPE